jgi:hypothetical protein
MWKVLVWLFFLHFVADFLLQSRSMGKNKSVYPLVLFQHLGIQFSIVFFGLIPFVGLKKAFLLSLANAVVHGVIDWNIWRGYKYFVMRRIYAAGPSSTENNPAHPLCDAKGGWTYWEDHWFYATIGLDQFLHMTTLTVLAGLML